MYNVEHNMMMVSGTPQPRQFPIHSMSHKKTELYPMSISKSRLVYFLKQWLTVWIIY